MATNHKICIVGGGNAGHSLAALLPFKGFETFWWASYGDEAERINKGLAEHGCITATFAAHNNPSGEVKGKPLLVSKDPADVIPKSDVLLMPLPSFAYWDVFKALKPHLRPGMMLGVTPGQGSVDWIAREVLGDLAKDLVIFSIMPMPFNCRITEFGKSVLVQTFKHRYRVMAVPVAKTQTAVECVKAIFEQEVEGCGHFLACTLYPINAVIHPQRLYRLLKDYKTGDILTENPLFYEAMDGPSAALMMKVTRELQEIGRCCTSKGIECDLPTIFDFLKWVYSEDAKKCVNDEDIFAINDAYKGFRCPYKQVEGGFVPDFTNRYFTEDIPLGLSVYKGVADIVGASCPMIDEVLGWAQGHMGKEYLVGGVGGTLTGKDVGETHAPQRFGITTVEGLKGPE